MRSWDCTVTSEVVWGGEDSQFTAGKHYPASHIQLASLTCKHSTNKQHSCLRLLRETILLSLCHYIWGMGLCEKASAPRKLSHITRYLCTGAVTSPGSPNRSTGTPDGHQLGKHTEPSPPNTGAPEKHGRETSIECCTVLSQMFHNLDYPRPTAPLKKTALTVQSQ